MPPAAAPLESERERERASERERERERASERERERERARERERERASERERERHFSLQALVHQTHSQPPRAHALHGRALERGISNTRPPLAPFSRLLVQGSIDYKHERGTPLEGGGVAVQGRGTLLTRKKRLPLAPYSRPMPRALGWSWV